MRYFLFLYLFLVLFVVGCSAQGNKDQVAEAPDSTKFEPQTKIQVNREYDDEGNLVRYDSTYSTYYSNMQGDSLKSDSAFNSFIRQFNAEYPFSDEPFFDELFFTDSLLHYDFYKDDFFQNRFEQNLKHMENYFRQMDSLKNYFFRQHLKENKIKGTSL
ncbi:hypothetical protein L21SP5_01700 [Salinivirga cyanobacteriivorans]|uniref:Uncharacterized protein n=1 Tax=Salinivirga cyanobacteriivorans TaxID=1307839 RepID=A0A0S2HZC4_9BACT|nr:hypothetical protein [Salinivirga cyanobacteriivorans]ALO15342.1 hypothetical protein L21SP5_01700 [Salinivirga cyanobacteriivorans]